MWNIFYITCTWGDVLACTTRGEALPWCIAGDVLPCTKGDVLPCTTRGDVLPREGGAADSTWKEISSYFFLDNAINN